jgi:hypothetical protein
MAGSCEFGNEPLKFTEVGRISRLTASECLCYMKLRHLIPNYFNCKKSFSE